MATRDTFVSINDGDQLNDGYFNGIYNSVPRVIASGSGTYSTASWGTLFSFTTPAALGNGKVVIMMSLIRTVGSASSALGIKDSEATPTFQVAQDSDTGTFIKMELMEEANTATNTINHYNISDNTPDEGVRVDSDCDLSTANTIYIRAQAGSGSTFKYKYNVYWHPEV